MITYKSGSIFTSRATCIVNPVNCVGVMGKGLALQFRQQYPAMYSRYQALCNTGDIAVGKTAFVTCINSHRVICLFPTKHHWRTNSTISIIERGLQDFIIKFPTLQLDSVAFPKLGCGLGGLDFERHIAPLMYRYLNHLPYIVEIYTD